MIKKTVMNATHVWTLLLFVILVFPTHVYAWKFAAYGDPRPGNAYDHSQNIYGMIYKIPNDQRVTVISSGDNNLDGIDSQWQKFRSIIAPLGIPTDNSAWTNYGIPKFLSAVGNHEVLQAGWQTRWSTYLPAQSGLSAYADIPSNAQGLWGSAKYGNALFMWLDFNSVPASQETFIQNTLSHAKSDPSIQWKFVILHGPPVSCGGTHSDWAKGKVWHDSYFYPNGVDIIFLGDNHYYERTCPFKSGLAASGTSEQNVCGPRGNAINYTSDGTHGVMHLVVGNGGAETANYAPTTQCPWLESDYRKGPIHGFVEIEITGNTLRGIAWDTDTNIGTNPILTAAQVANLATLDEFTIIHESTGSTPTPPLSKSGDLNQNGTVDIFDYNIMVTDFGKTGANGFIPADIDKNGKVDIFDYNILIGNFGK